MLRNHFHLPLGPGSEPAIYFCGNSLGLQPKSADEQIEHELATWRKMGVEGWWRGGWVDYHERLQRGLAGIVGAQPEEVVAANALTVNLHLLLTSFYRAEGRRCKVIIEKGAFPSDRYAIVSHMRLHGLDVEECLIEVGPEGEEAVLATEEIESAIEEVGEELALVLWTGVQYYTGQFFDLGRICAAGRSVGATVGLDLAHAVGNVPLTLHEWGCDFAVWCNYKYLNGGPGAPGGMYVHERYAERPGLQRLAGWWGHRPEDRFAMRPDFRPAYGAAGWQVSTVPILGMAPLLASLSLFEEVGGVGPVRERSIELTDLLYRELSGLAGVKILTGQDRGAQLSIFLEGERPGLEGLLSAAGLICDYREDNLDGSGGGVLRLAPAPLYNTEAEVRRSVAMLERVLAGKNQNS